MLGPIPSDPAAQAAPAQEGAPQDSQGGGASQLVSGINSQLMQLMDIVGQSPAVDEADKHALQGVVQGFQSFVDGLGSAKAGEPQGGVTSPEAGAREVKPVQ
jgi:hypothetical protein